MLSEIQNWLKQLESRARLLNMLTKENNKGLTWLRTNQHKSIKEKLKKGSEQFSSQGRLLSHASGENSFEKWPYDFTLQESDQENQLIGIRLIAEIDLSGSSENCLLHDFYKILQADADVKLLVIQKEFKEGFITATNEYEKTMKAYKHKLKSEILLACWITSEDRFAFKRYSIDISYAPQ
jgi:hypothetical protein